MSIIVNSKLSNKGIIFHLDSLNKRCYSGSGTKVNDLSSNSVSLTTRNITWLESSGFTHTSGTFSYLSTDNSDNTLSDRISISAWIKCSKNSDFQTIIGDNSQNVTTPFIWIYRSNNNGDNLYFQYQDSSPTWGSVSSPNFFTGYDDVWVNLTLVIDYVMGVLKVYRNGYQFGSNITLSGTISPNLTNSYFKKLYIGSYDSERHWIRGSISRLIIWNKLLTSSEVLSNYSSIDMNKYYSSTSNSVVKSGLILNLDANISSSYPGVGNIWYDTYNSSNAVMLNSSFDNSVVKSVIFSTNAYATINPISDLQGNKPFTVAGWFRKNANWPSGSTWAIGSTGLNCINSFSLNNDQSISINLWGTTTFSTGQFYSDTEWKYIVWVYNGVNFSRSNFVIYINGVAYTGNSLTVLRGSEGLVPSISGSVYLGRSGSTDEYYSNIKISKFSIYNRVLSQAEVVQNFNSTKSLFIV